MAKRLIALCIVLSTMVSFALAAYVKSTMCSLPDLDQIDGYRYVCESSYCHLYTHDAKGLEDLMENSDAVVLGKTDDAGVLKARSIKKQIHVIERIKGTTEDYLAYYEPVYLMHDHSIIADRGYLPMLPEYEYLLFLKEVKNPEDGTCLYYPVSSDIGKYEKGKKRLFGSMTKASLTRMSRRKRYIWLKAVTLPKTCRKGWICTTRYAMRWKISGDKPFSCI